MIISVVVIIYIYLPFREFGLYLSPHLLMSRNMKQKYEQSLHFNWSIQAQSECNYIVIIIILRDYRHHNKNYIIVLLSKGNATKCILMLSLT